MKSICTLLLIFVASIPGAEETIDLWQGEPPYSRPNSFEDYVKEL